MLFVLCPCRTVTGPRRSHRLSWISPPPTSLIRQVGGLLVQESSQTFLHALIDADGTQEGKGGLVAAPSTPKMPTSAAMGDGNEGGHHACHTSERSHNTVRSSMRNDPNLVVVIAKNAAATNGGDTTTAATVAAASAAIRPPPRPSQDNRGPRPRDDDLGRCGNKTLAQGAQGQAQLPPPK